MADETGEDLEKLMEGLDLGEGAAEVGDGAGDLGDVTGGSVLEGISTEVGDRGSGARGRIVGLVALLLGVIGSLLMAILAAVIIRVGFTAGDTADRVIEPVKVSFDRMDDRIDQADELLDRNGIAAEQVDELQARVDGLVDVSTGAHQGFEAIEDHPVYGLLPAALSSLGDDLGAFEASSVEVDRLLGSATEGSPPSSAAIESVATELNGMQDRVSEVRDAFTSAETSLRRWIRLGAFFGFFGSLWGLWGQVSLAKRGWRGFRGRSA